MQAETSLDLRYNIAAMYIAILGQDIRTPEQAFAVLEKTPYELTDKDMEDIEKMQKQGITYKEIADMYGYTVSGIKAKVYRHRKRDLPDGSLERSTI